MVDGFTDVLGCKVGRESAGQAFADSEEGSAGVCEGLNVALVGDEGDVGVCKDVTL